MWLTALHEHCVALLICNSTCATHSMYSVVQAEKQHQNLLNGVEHFDKSCMKHTETAEKNPLPPIEGLYKIYVCFLSVLPCTGGLHFLTHINIK